MQFEGRRISCPICGSGEERHEVVSTRDRDGAELRTVLCASCGLVFNNPMPTEAEVARFYRDDYRALYKGGTRPKPKHIYRAARMAVQRFGAVAKYYKPKGSYLDLGAGGGEYVYLLKQKGFSAEGIEPNIGYAQFAADEYGVKIHVGSYANVDLPTGGFDLVSSFHVFEHLTDPMAAFARARSWLKPGGRLYLEVPNVDAAEQTFRSRFHFAHVYQYSPATLAAMAAKAGFACERSFFGGQAGLIRMLFRMEGSPVASAPAPTPETVAATRAVLTAKRPLGARWGWRNVRKYLDRIRENRAVRGLSGREVADSIILDRKA